MAKEHSCKENETVAQLAAKYGYFDWQTLWNANSDLKRGDGNTLYKADERGDVVQLPEKKVKSVSKQADTVAPTYTFKVPKYKVWLNLRILKDDFTPVKQANYELSVDGAKAPFEGKTDDQGQLSHEIPLNAATGVLTVRVKATDTDPPESGSAPAKSPKPARGEIPITWGLKIGKLNPIKEQAPDKYCVTGTQQRLNNLNLNSGPINGILTQNTKAAVEAFQQLYQIATPAGNEGEPDVGGTQTKLELIHDKPGAVPAPPKPQPKK